MFDAAAYSLGNAIEDAAGAIDNLSDDPEEAENKELKRLRKAGA
ncbi:MAG TPA: hypothetical protein VG796_14710 [Verrucomicrobiales bacterium]|nr:hypothetical protein [Verrucomicrobiales bacterium]